METRVVNRRDFLRLSGIAGAGLMAVACGATPPAPTAAETSRARCRAGRRKCAECPPGSNHTKRR